MKWSSVYKQAIQKDGSLLFPERLTKEFLDSARRTMGSYLFANQYQNEVIPEDAKSFKKEWLRYYSSIPEKVINFGFIDPAIGQKNHNDYTGIVVISAAIDMTWYVRLAVRERLTPTGIIKKMFELCEQYKLMCLGVETVAYQEALLYMLDEEMKKRKKIIPVKGIKRDTNSKETRILGLVPRFEYGRLFLNQGMVDFEDEYHTFPRGKHDDILDATASLEEIVTYPFEEKKKLEKPHSEHDPNYERWIIQQYQQGRNPNGNSITDDD